MNYESQALPTKLTFLGSGPPSYHYQIRSGRWWSPAGSLSFGHLQSVAALWTAGSLTADRIGWHRHMARGGYGLPKVSLGLPCLTLLRPGGRPPLKQAVSGVQVGKHQAARLWQGQPFSSWVVGVGSWQTLYFLCIPDINLPWCTVPSTETRRRRRRKGKKRTGARGRTRRSKSRKGKKPTRFLLQRLVTSQFDLLALATNLALTYQHLRLIDLNGYFSLVKAYHAIHPVCGPPPTWPWVAMYRMATYS
jgi:hypothetical protein